MKICARITSDVPSDTCERGLRPVTLPPTILLIRPFRRNGKDTDPAFSLPAPGLCSTLFISETIMFQHFDTVIAFVFLMLVASLFITAATQLVISLLGLRGPICGAA